MKTTVKTSVTISKDLLKELDEFVNGECSRSELVEKALRKYLDDLKLWRRVRENAEKEKEILNRMAVEQREEIEDNLRFVAEVSYIELKSRLNKTRKNFASMLLSADENLLKPLIAL